MLGSLSIGPGSVIIIVVPRHFSRKFGINGQIQIRTNSAQVFWRVVPIFSWSNTRRSDLKVSSQFCMETVTCCMGIHEYCILLTKYFHRFPSSNGWKVLLVAYCFISGDIASNHFQTESVFIKLVSLTVRSSKTGRSMYFYAQSNTLSGHLRKSICFSKLTYTSDYLIVLQDVASLL